MPYNRHPRSYKKRIQHPRDKKKLAVMAYLASINPSTATKTNIAKKAKLRSQEAVDFTNLMNELVSIGWVEKKLPESIDGYEHYCMTEKGQDALNEAKELVRKKSPLSSLDVFKDVFEP